MRILLSLSATTRVALLALGLCAVPLGGLAVAQTRPAPAGELSVGWAGFADDGVVSETLVGASARLYVSPRLAIGPEVVYIRGDKHSHVIATANLTWDVLPALNGHRVTPFLVVGGGVFHTHESFPGGTFTSREGAFTGGGGIRSRIGNRVFAGVEARVGWELHLRLSGVVGIQLER